MTPERLANSVARALTRKSDLAFLQQPPPVSPAVAPVAGLANTPSLVAAQIDSTLDKLIDLEATVRSNLANPQLWLTSPDMWAALRKLKESTTNNNMSLLGAGTDDAQPRLLTISVVVNPSKTGFLIDP